MLSGAEASGPQAEIDVLKLKQTKKMISVDGFFMSASYWRD